MTAQSTGLPSWRVMTLLGVLAACSIPACLGVGVFERWYGDLVMPFAAISPAASLFAFVIARLLWKLEHRRG